MLTRAEINKAINAKIKREFPGIPIQSRDVEEGFQRPSFFVSLETDRTEMSQFNTLREMTCRILYFPKDRHAFKEEVYDVQDRLEKLFGLNFAVGGRTITINDAESSVVDKVLHYDFDFSFYDESTYEEPGGGSEELMEELSFRG